MSMFPPLVLADWQETRDALHGYARVLGNIRRHMAPPSKHWWHITLSVSARGLTTTTIPARGMSFDLTLNPMLGQVEISTSEGGESSISFHGQSQRSLHDAIAASLLDLGVQRSMPADLADTEYDYVSDAAARYWRVLSQVDSIYKEFKGSLREETGPVQIFPHHFDLSLNWFSGRLIPGADPEDAATADEQMNFGFLTGDSSIAEA